MRLFSFCLLFLFILSCKPVQKSTVVVNTDTVTIHPSPEVPVYHGAYTRYNDLVHTKLEISFDWAKKYLNGKATITLHPHFYPQDSLVLNARGMDIRKISMLSAPSTILQPQTSSVLPFRYDSLKLYIKLDREYKKDEDYTIVIYYTAKPDELRAGGSAAITRDKGLYFINPKGRDPEKPRQVWTQGETESNSAWFPTIEDPQQRMTQEIYMTVDSSMTTVSNGLLITSTINHDGTKTDYWKQSLTATPYLTMIAASDFAVVKDKWKNIEVNYYLDKEYEQYARLIFGHTPEMIEFYSNKFGVPYVWEKFSQVVVHDYVSGAMENTTAVIHGTNMLEDSSDYLDGNYENYISHELSHHWFGDLVTCESWSNITLNEGFANYSEYLWREYKFGKDAADYLNQFDQNVYLMASKSDDPDLIRFDYEGREDVYDAISYNKGARVLHMLRKYLGDDAFFAALKLYLTEHKYGSAEVHDLRLAFEKVTGEDLNWYFNEWFLNHGHPIVDISYNWSDSSKTETVTIEQKQDFSKNPLYKIPLLIDVYHDGEVDTKKVTIQKSKEKFSWKLSSKPDLVNVDADKMLLCEKKDHKSNDNLIFQFYHAPLYLDRYESISKTGTEYVANSSAGKMTEDALNDPFWNIRLQAMKNIGVQLNANKDRLKAKLIDMAAHDEKSQLRSQAIRTLVKYFKNDSEAQTAIEKRLIDSSYLVKSVAFKAVADYDKNKAERIAPLLGTSNGGNVINAVATFYKDQGRAEDNNFFLSALDRTKGYERTNLIDTYVHYLKKVDLTVMQKGIDKLYSIGQYASGRGKKAIISSLEDLKGELDSRIESSKSKQEELEKEKAVTSEINSSKREEEQIAKQRDELKEKIKNLKSAKD